MPEATDYSLRLYYSPEDQEYVAISPEFPGLSALAPTQAEAVAQMQVVLGMAMDTYLESQRDLPTPAPPEDTVLPSGEFRVRLPRSLHAQLSQRARDEGVSQNTLLIQYIAHGLALAQPRRIQETEALISDRT